MSPDAVRRWLDQMRAAHKIRSDLEAAEALGVSPQAISEMKRHGVGGRTSRRTALAMAALLAGVAAFDEARASSGEAEGIGSAGFDLVPHSRPL